MIRSTAVSGPMGFAAGWATTTCMPAVASATGSRAGAGDDTIYGSDEGADTLSGGDDQDRIFGPAVETIRLPRRG